MQHESDELNSSFLNRLTLWWFNPIPLLGARKNLELNDLYQLNEGNTSAYLHNRWNSLWQPVFREYNRRRKILDAQTDSSSKLKRSDSQLKPPSIVWLLFLMFKYDILSATGIKILSDTLQFANPFFLNLLIGFIAKGGQDLAMGIAFALAIFFSSEIRSFLINQYFFLMMRISVKIQSTLTTAIYNKTLKLSNSARNKRTVGEIVNYMAIDAERFQLITPQIQQYWSCPYQITLALIYLFYTLGISAICGVIVMLFFIPVNVIASVINKKWQMEQMKLKDERTKTCNEILNGMKVIKLYAWEPPMEQVVERIRRKELQLIKKAAMVRSIADTFNTISPFLVALLTFAAYTLSSPKHLLTPQIAFVSLTLFNQLRSPMTMIALLISQTVQALVANRRLKHFFVAEELDIDAIDHDFSDHHDEVQHSIKVKDAQCMWDSKNPDGVIFKIDQIDIPRGSLVAVVGKVGSGKSTLLSAILGEMEKQKGYIGIHGSIAYFGQQAWIQNMSLRQNIIFGGQFDQRFYETVIDACALQKDLALLPQHDQTEIGEKGINLSGGQKARVALARAIYQNCDIYLLDDPLSAVDSHVGKHIFEKVIGSNGLLYDKTRILVTNSLAYLAEADSIIFMKDGKIMDIGSHKQLLDNSSSFAAFIEQCQLETDSVANSDDNTDSEQHSSEGLVVNEEKEEEGQATSSDSEEFKEPLLDEAIANESSDFRSSIARLRPQKKHRQSSLSIEQAHTVSRVSLRESKKSKKSSDKLIQAEEVEIGRVKLNVYIQFVKAATVITSIGFVLFFSSYAALQLVRGFWLSKWSNANDEVMKNPNSSQISIGVRLAVYASIGIFEGIGFFLSMIFLVLSGLNASYNLHTPLFYNILRSPMTFFDTTPIGRILNRLGKDIDVIDQLLPINFRYFIYCMVNATATMTVIVISTPIFASVILPLAAIYYASLHFYVPTSRQIKRLTSVSSSPIYTHFSETIQGAVCIRAFQKVNKFCELSGERIDISVRCKYSSILSNRWLAVRLELVGNCVVLFAALFAVLSPKFGAAISAGVAGLSISYALNITEVLNFAVRQISELETNIVAVERVKEYSETPSEAEWRAEDFNDDGWPSNGQIIFKDFSLRYRPGLELVIKQLNAVIEPSEKIGIVGRTGAGKSSLTLALFRIIEAAEGNITIDGVNIGLIGLHDLRSNLTIIPQEPVLFSGTVRFNLDPFDRYTDAKIWEALELAHLKDFVAQLANGLDHSIAEGGENISVGQRQLICLARALLRDSKILVLDEATAAIDMATDVLIQETIRREFHRSTVLTIAHRLNTVLDYDRVMVLDGGRIVEFDSPQKLLKDRSSQFFSMASDANIVNNQLID